MTTHYLLQLVISGLVIGSIYAAVALGFTIIYKATRVVNFAQGEFLMVGAYVCYAFLVQMHVPFWAALLLTILFALAMVRLAVFSVFFKFSKAGVAMRATAFNQQTAQSMGISVKSIFALSWIISAVVSGVG